MGTHTDESYAYSQHLLWGLGEGTSTVLVFCAPAFPIIFNSGRRSSRLKISSSWSPGHRKHPSEEGQRPWPRLAHKRGSVDDYHRMNEGSATHLQELEQGNYEMRSSQRLEEEHPLHSYLGLGIMKTGEHVYGLQTKPPIMKTTEIQISTHTGTNSPTTNRRQEELRHPWTEIRSCS